MDYPSMDYIDISEPSAPVHENAQPQNWCKLGQAAIAVEMEAIQALYQRIDQNFEKACQIILNCQGRVILIGIGKSGHVAKKIAATLASTGTPAFYLHAAEANHGDIGMITPSDVILMVSYSGETTEIIQILPTIQRLHTPLIAMTGYPHSSLGQQARAILNVYVEKEACPLGLAPTASTTVSLVMGDALAIALLKARGFNNGDFARNHPGGSLGRRLSLRVSDIMHTGEEIPRVSPHCRLDEALFEITKKRFGLTTVIDANNQLLGIFTDGDLRRTLDHGYNIHTTPIEIVMTTDPITISKDLLASTTLKLMRANKITALIVVNKDHVPIGLIHWHDLTQAGILE